QAQRDFIEPPMIQLAPGLIVVLVFEQVFPFRTDRLAQGKFSELAHFEPDIPVELLRTKNMVLPFPRLIGGDAPVEFSLRNEIRGVGIDTKGSKVNLDLAEITNKAVEAGVRRISIPSYPSPGVPSPEEALDSYIHDVKPLFEGFTGQ